MLNQLRFKRNNFREFVVRFHKVIIDKNNITNILHKTELMIEQANNIAYKYQ